MKKVKLEKKGKSDAVVKVAHYYKFKGRPMAFISGNFMGGGFGISKNKAKAILDNAAILKEFVKGVYDTQIMDLNEDENEVLQV